MLSNGKVYELRIDLKRANGGEGYALYSNFTISDSTDNYRLHAGHFLEGNAGESIHVRHESLGFLVY